MEDFLLERELDQAEEKMHTRRKRSHQGYINNNFQIQIFKLQSELHEIIEDFFEQGSENQYYSDSYSEFQSSFDEENHSQINSNAYLTSYYINKATQNSHNQHNQQEEENQSTIDLPNFDYSSTIEAFSNNPKTQIFKKVSEIESLMGLYDDEKKELLKKFIERYVLDYQLYYFQQNWKYLPQQFKEIAPIIKKKSEELFGRKIGGISFAARRIKLLKYFQKKKGRIWRKKVSYDCRKKVADGRLRIKGKFVTREQACVQLGVPNLDMFTAEQIKNLLEKKLESIDEFESQSFQAQQE